MKTLKDVAEYHDLQARILENTRAFMAQAALPTDEMERDIRKHKDMADAARSYERDAARLDWLDARIPVTETQTICGVHADMCGDLRTAIDCAMEDRQKP